MKKLVKTTYQNAPQRKLTEELTSVCGEVADKLLEIEEVLRGIKWEEIINCQ